MKRDARKKAARIGRPPKRPADRKRNNLTFRVDDALRAQLEEAAFHHDRSISEHIEHQLQRDAGLADKMGATVYDFGLLARYLEIMRALTERAGDSPGQWAQYAQHVPFALDLVIGDERSPDHRRVLDDAARAVRAAVDAVQTANRVFLDRHGHRPNRDMVEIPEDPEGRTAARAKVDHDAEHRWHKRRFDEIEANRRRLAKDQEIER